MAGVQKIRSTALRSDCQNNLRNLTTAIFHYESREGRLPPGAIAGPFPPHKVPDDVNHGLWSTLLGELEQPQAASAYHWDLDATDLANQASVNTRIDTLLCPSLADGRIAPGEDGRTARVADFAPVDVNPFLADIGEIGSSENFEGPLPVNGMVRLVEVSDGAGCTLLIAEASGRPGVAWSSPTIPVSIRFIRGGASHLGGANVAFCDGSVRFLKSSTDLKLLAKLATRSGNESLGEDW